MNALVPLSPQHAMSIAQAFATAKMVPQHFKQSVGDCYIAVTMAHRFNMDVFLLMQELFIINGRPMLSGKLTAAICNHNLAEPLTPTYSGEGNNRKITIVGRVAGRDPQSIEVTVAQVRTSNEQWQKNPDQMLFYAGSRMWARRYTPDVILGILFDDEAEAVEAPKPTLQSILAIQKRRVVHGRWRVRRAGNVFEMDVDVSHYVFSLVAMVAMRAVRCDARRRVAQRRVVLRFGAMRGGAERRNRQNKSLRCAAKRGAALRRGALRRVARRGVAQRRK